MTIISNVKRSDKLFSEKDLAQDNIDSWSIDNHAISSCPLVKSLKESSNTHRIREYEVKDISEQLLKQDMD
jgi:hypothetical protein